jgi:hypothetical protein
MELTLKNNLKKNQMVLIVDNRRIKPIEISNSVVGDLKLKLDKKYLEFFYNWLMISIDIRGMLKPKIDYVKSIILLDPFSNFVLYENSQISTLNETEKSIEVTIIYDYNRNLEKDEIREIKLKELLDEKTY